MVVPPSSLPVTDRLKHFIARRLVHPLAGMTAGDWWSMLRRHRFAIDAPYWPRALIQTALSAANSVNARIERQVHGSRIERTVVAAPLFILGHYRSGTTHLHNLLALDPARVAPTFFQVLNPHTFLTTQRWGAPLADLLTVRRRFQDEVALGAGVPSEDELALGTMTGLSPYLAWCFPREAATYDRYLTFQGVPAADVARWGQALRTFLQKVTLQQGRGLILKSPPHTARIGLLLDLFPDARFVHIHRHPHDVFRSTRHTIRTVQPVYQFQHGSPRDSDDTILNAYAAMHEAYFDQRRLVPAGQLREVRFDDLRRDPTSVVGSIYEALGLPGFAGLRPRLAEYLASVASFRPNHHDPLAEPLRQRIDLACDRSFAEWGYER